MNYDERGASVRRARMAQGLGDMELAHRLEAEGWKYDPKPVLPVVSAEAVKAYDYTYASRFDVHDGFGAAFKVMLADGLRHYADTSARIFYGDARTFYHILTGEDWPK